MEKIEKLESKPVNVPSAVRTGFECSMPTDEEFMDKINEVVDRVNALSDALEPHIPMPQASSTDREKAAILAKAYARQYHHSSYPEYSDNSEFVFSNEEIEQACIEMAEWKELSRRNLKAEIMGVITDKMRELCGKVGSEDNGRSAVYAMDILHSLCNEIDVKIG